MPSPQPQKTTSWPRSSSCVLTSESSPPHETGMHARKTALSVLKTHSSPADEPATSIFVPPCMPTEKYCRLRPDDGIAILLAATVYCIECTSNSNLKRCTAESEPA